jgi:TetR/AcrR family transcriptional regulator, transcriptional repressor for nem operon
MRISKEKTAENRESLVRAASRLIRERGIDGVGVAEISKAAGLTHGALYAHFRSKEALALAALSHGLEQTCAGLGEDGRDGMPGLERYLDRFLSVEGRDDYAGGCPIAASASEIGRQDQAISTRFSQGYLEMVSTFERELAAARPGEDARGRALTLVATLVGAQAVARGAAKGDPALSEQVLRAARKVIGETIMAPADGPAP